MMKVSWDDIGRSPIAGFYFVQGSNVIVKDKDIALWRSNPKVVFDTIWSKRPGEIAGTYSLVRWDDQPN